MVLKPIVGTPEWLDRNTSLLQNREAMAGILCHLLSLNYYHHLSSRWKSQQYVFLSNYNCENIFMATLHQYYMAISYRVLQGYVCTFWFLAFPLLSVTGFLTNPKPQGYSLVTTDSAHGENDITTNIWYYEKHHFLICSWWHGWQRWKVIKVTKTRLHISRLRLELCQQVGFGFCLASLPSQASGSA